MPISYRSIQRGEAQRFVTAEELEAMRSVVEAARTLFDSYAGHSCNHQYCGRCALQKAIAATDALRG